MRKNLNVGARACIDQFVLNLGVEDRGIALQYITLPNGQNYESEFLRLQAQYGDKLRKILGQIEVLRKNINCEYGALERGLQLELERRLPQQN